MSNIPKKPGRRPLRLMFTSIQPPVTVNQTTSPKPRTSPSEPLQPLASPESGKSLSEIMIDFPIRVIPAVSLSNSQTMVVEELGVGVSVSLDHATTLSDEAVEPLTTEEVPLPPPPPPPSPRPSLRESGKLILPDNELAEPPKPGEDGVLPAPSLSSSGARRSLDARTRIESSSGSKTRMAPRRPRPEVSGVSREVSPKPALDTRPQVQPRRPYMRPPPKSWLARNGHLFLWALVIVLIAVLAYAMLHTPPVTP